MDTPNVHEDMAQYFDFGQASIPEPLQEDAEPDSIPAASTKFANCPVHGNQTSDGGQIDPHGDHQRVLWKCLCHGFHDVDVPADLQAQPYIEPEVEWNGDFSTWIPRYQKPAQPCDYCRSRSLECFIYNADGTSHNNGCSPCNALFRPCSFSQKVDSKKYRTTLDTLDLVPEVSVRQIGGMTGKKPMRCLGHVGPIEVDEVDKPKKGAAAARFPRAAVKVLKDWMLEHIDHPYPTEEEKEMLKEQTGLSSSQISNWMANTRRRHKARPKRAASPTLRPSTEAIDIPAGRTWEELNPFERWKHSPPENEPAPMTAIAKAVETFDPPEPSSLSSSLNGRKGNSNDSTGSFSIFRAPSTTSLETGLTQGSSGSAQSHGSAWSYSSRNSLGSMNSLKSKERRRRRRLPTRTSRADQDTSPRLFQCTFCTDRFKSKYDWSRHEKSLHLSLEKWICGPLGDVVVCSSSGQRKCTYCDAIEPSEEHLESHNHKACIDKGREACTFYRKDHLRQHLRLMHGCKMIPSMETWKSEAQLINSRCGFCSLKFTKWQDRVDHLAKEFRNGAEMKDWKGCRGLDPHVAVHVTNAMPPYLIANESKSPFPFSASNAPSMKHHNFYHRQGDLEYLLPSDGNYTNGGIFIPHYMGDVPIDSSISPTTAPFNTSQHDGSSSSQSPKTDDNPNATCWEILTLRLGRFARESTEKNGPHSVTDEMLQTKARMILYDSDDPWNQTAADNPEWLSLFRKAHGLHSAPVGPYADHEVLEDLGLHPTSRLDRSFNLNNFSSIQGTEGANKALAFEYSLTGSHNISRNAAQRLSRLSSVSALSMPDLISSSTTSANSNIPVTAISKVPELDCSQPGAICIGEDGELGVSNGDGTCSRWNPDLSAFTTATDLECRPAIATGDKLSGGGRVDNLDQLLQGFNLPGTTAGLTDNITASAGLGDFGMSSAEAIQGGKDSAQAMRWDDHELSFDMDLDMDIDMGFTDGAQQLL